VDQPLPMPSGVSDLAVGGYSSVPEPGMASLLVFSAAAILGVVLFRRRRSRVE
jgi:hypothetical protein